MATLELVVFDMAGTTVADDGLVARAFVQALACAGVTVTRAEVDTWMGHAKPVAIRALLQLKTGTAPSDADVARVHARFRRALRAAYRGEPGAREIPGARDTFHTLRARGVRVALDTGFDRELADAVMAALGWRVGRDVHALVASDEVATGRPAPDMIRALCRRLGVTTPAHVAKVGDTPVDMEEGVRAGCGAILGVATGGFAEARLREAGATAYVPTVTDVPVALAQHELPPKSRRPAPR